jgi:hypothetical protein
LSHDRIVLFSGQIFTVKEKQLCILDDGEVVEDFNYLALSLMVVAEVFGVAASLIVIDKSRKWTQSMSYFVASFTLFIMVMPIPPSVRVFFGMLARASIMAASSVTWIVTPELYPTHARVTGHTAANAVARLGGMISPFVGNMPAPIWLIGGIYATSNLILSMSSCALPETTGKALDSITEDDVAIAIDTTNKSTRVTYSSQGRGIGHRVPTLKATKKVKSRKQKNKKYTQVDNPQ